MLSYWKSQQNLDQFLPDKLFRFDLPDKVELQNLLRRKSGHVSCYDSVLALDEVSRFLTFSFRTFDWKVGCCTIWKSVVVVSQGYQIRWQMFDRFHHQSDRLFRWVLPCKANLLIDRFDAWNDLIQILLENLCAHHHRHHVYSGLDSWSGVYPVVGQPCNREHSPTQQVSWWCSVRGYPGHEVYPGPGYPRWDRTPSPHQARWTELLQAWRSNQTWWCKVDLVLGSTYTDKNKNVIL